MSLSLRAGRAALAEDMGMTLLPRTHSIMALCCWRCALSCALCDERGGDVMNDERDDSTDHRPLLYTMLTSFSSRRRCTWMTSFSVVRVFSWKIICGGGLV